MESNEILDEPKYPMIEIISRNPDEPMTGSNCVLLFDGKPMVGAVSFDLHIEAGGIATATIKLIGRVKVLGKFDSVNVTVKED